MVPWSVLRFGPRENGVPVDAILRPTGVLEKELAIGTGAKSVTGVPGR